MRTSGSCLICYLKVTRYTVFAEVDFVEGQCSRARNATPLFLICAEKSEGCITTEYFAASLNLTEM